MHHKDAIGKVVKSVSAPLRIARYAKLEWRLDLQVRFVTMLVDVRAKKVMTMRFVNSAVDRVSL